MLKSCSACLCIVCLIPRPCFIKVTGGEKLFFTPVTLIKHIFHPRNFNKTGPGDEASVLSEAGTKKKKTGVTCCSGPLWARSSGPLWTRKAWDVIGLLAEGRISYNYSLHETSVLT